MLLKIMEVVINLYLGLSDTDKLNKANQANHNTKANQSSELLQTIKGFDSTIGNKGGRSDHKSDDVIRGLREDRRNAQSRPANQKSYDRWSDYTNKQIKLGKMTKGQADDFLKTKKYSNASLEQLIKTFSKKGPKRIHPKTTGYDIGKYLSSIKKSDRDSKLKEYLFKYQSHDINPEIKDSFKVKGKPFDKKGWTKFVNDSINSNKYKAALNALDKRVDRMHKSYINKNKKKIYGFGAAGGALVGTSTSGIALFLLNDKIIYHLKNKHPNWTDDQINKRANLIKIIITSGGTLAGSGLGAYTSRKLADTKYNQAKQKIKIAKSGFK